MCHMSCVMCNVSHVMCHMSCVTCHVPHVPCHLGPVTCHLSFITCQSGKTSEKSVFLLGNVQSRGGGASTRIHKYMFFLSWRPKHTCLGGSKINWGVQTFFCVDSIICYPFFSLVDQWDAWELVMWSKDQWEALIKTASYVAHRQTHRHINKHLDSLAESAQWADSVKKFQQIHKWLGIINI